MRWYAYKNFVRRSVDLMAVDERGGAVYEGQPMTVLMKRIEEAQRGEVREPTLSIPHDYAQELLQALWDEGFRPNNGEGGTAESAALRKHIEFAEKVATALLPSVKG